jgi:hypothetical protein
MIIATLPVSKQKEFISHLILGKYLTEIYIGLLRGFVPGFVNYKKGCTRLAAASDSLPVACPWSVVLSRYCGFLHH